LAAAVADAQSAARRRAGRLTLAIDDASVALTELGSGDGCSPPEKAAVGYDRAVYLALLGRSEDARDELQRVATQDAWLCAMAQTDPLLEGTGLDAHAGATFGAIRARVIADCDEQLVNLRAATAVYEALLAEYRAAGFDRDGTDLSAWLRTGTGVTVELEQFEVDITSQRDRLQPRVSEAAASRSQQIRDQAERFAREEARPKAEQRMLQQHLDLVSTANDLFSERGTRMSVTAEGAWIVKQSRRGGREIETAVWVGVDGAIHKGTVDIVPARPVASLPVAARAAIERHIALIQAGISSAMEHRADNIRMLSHEAFAFSKTHRFGPSKEWIVRRGDDGVITVGHQ
jgi:hypothetical protein